MNKNDLSKEQKEEIQKLADEVLKEARLVIEDYKENPSELEGTITSVHENSPLLNSE